MKESRKIEIIYEALHCYFMTVNQNTLPQKTRGIIKDFSENRAMLNLINEIDIVLMEYQEKLNKCIDNNKKP